MFKEQVKVIYTERSISSTNTFHRQQLLTASGADVSISVSPPQSVPRFIIDFTLSGTTIYLIKAFCIEQDLKRFRS